MVVGAVAIVHSNSLFPKADAIQSLPKKKNPNPKSNLPRKPDLKNGSEPVRVPTRASGSSDRTIASITHTTALPRSLRPSSPPPAVPNHGHIKDPKLRTQLNRHAANAACAKTLLKDAALLLTEELGCVAVSVGGGMEETWRVGQEEIVRGWAGGCCGAEGVVPRRGSVPVAEFEEWQVRALCACGPIGAGGDLTNVEKK
ncbi:hypothetical protein HD554DRAFT_852850 [Boletus coccyginus]|nr:hypothetical protein HD554DRAFT_852850 [Boletus coccyginus]